MGDLSLFRQFAHGQTYQAHPMVCAAAVEVQRIIQTEKLVENAAKMGKILEAKLRACFSKHPHVGNIRGRGLFWGVSLECLPFLLTISRAVSDLSSPESLR